MYLKKIAYLSVFVALTSCKVHFQESTRTKIEKEEQASLEDIQFYNDHTIKLYYKTQKKQSEVANGTVKFKRGSYVQMVKIPRNTPGIAEVRDDQSLNVFFDEKQTTPFVFSFSGPGQGYSLQSDSVDGKFITNYDGIPMELIAGKSASLTIKKKDDVDRETSKQKLDGIRVSSN